jgi:hypothetical protein
MSAASDLLTYPGWSTSPLRTSTDRSMTVIKTMTASALFLALAASAHADGGMHCRPDHSGGFRCEPNFVPERRERRIQPPPYSPPPADALGSFLDGLRQGWQGSQPRETRCRPDGYGGFRCTEN